jgi:hypothetical protein
VELPISACTKLQGKSGSKNLSATWMERDIKMVSMNSFNGLGLQQYHHYHYHHSLIEIIIPTSIIITPIS